MREKELRKLRRVDLLDLLVQQVKENDRLKKELEEKEKILLNYRIQCQEAGSIAQAALKINQVFEAAQKAADQYLDGIRLLKEQAEAQQPQELPQEEQTDWKLEDMLREADALSGEEEKTSEEKTQEDYLAFLRTLESREDPK